jgi:hypothetical protein
VRTIAEMNLPVRACLELPVGRQLTTDQFRESWELVQPEDAGKLKRGMQTSERNLIQSMESSLSREMDRPEKYRLVGPRFHGTVLGGGCAMKFDEAAIRARSLTEAGIWLSITMLALLPLCVATPQIACAQKQEFISTGNGPLATTQVVDNLIAMNLRRSQALHSYEGSRTYRVEYRGFPHTVNAEMVVDVRYRAPGIKEFTIRSSTGSKLIIDKVIRKLLQAEEDALSADTQQRTALSRENYDFTMAGYESTPSRSMYVLFVEPRTKSKFVFRGRVWVDADDFAVVRLEAEPAKSPSFWTKSSQIEQSYIKVSDFWLPERNHSISSIRLGGRAELTIEYQKYRITASDPVGSTPEEGNLVEDQAIRVFPRRP